MMPLKAWWALRRRFRSTIPGLVTAIYLATTLNMSERSARNNVFPTLRRTGLIDENDKPTQLANEWRDDSTYGAVCKQIREEVYPQELLDLASDESASRDEVQRWFAAHTASGQSATRKMAAFYLLLLDANPDVEVSATAGSAPADPKQKPARGVKRARATSQKSHDVGPPDEQAGDRGSGTSGPSGAKRPSLHLNIQIHLSPESSPEQIDVIFASMAKHLKSFG